MKQLKIKKTGQVVYPVSPLGEQTVPTGYQQVLVPFEGVSRKGNRGQILVVRKDSVEEMK